MGVGQSKENKPAKSEESPKRAATSPEKKCNESVDKTVEQSPVKDSSPSKTEKPQSPEKTESPVKTEAGKGDDAPCTPPKPEEVIQVSPEDLASVEAAATKNVTKEGGLRYDVVLSPAVKTGPKLTPASSPMTEDDINKKLKEAEDRKVSMDNIRMKNLTVQLAKIEIVQQKREELDTEKKTKAAEKLTEKMSTADEKRAAQLNEIKERLSVHMDKIQKAQDEITAQIEAAKSAAESQLSEKLETAEKNRLKEMEEMLVKLKEHKEKIDKVRSNKEESLKPQLAELEANIKERLERADQLRAKHEEQILEKLQEQNRRAEIVRQNKERIMAEGGSVENTTNESA